MSATATDIVTDIRERVDALPWSELRASLDDRGHAITPVLLTPGSVSSCRRCSTAAGSGRRSTWPGTASATAATATSTTHCPTRSPRCGRRSTGIWRRSPTTGQSFCAGRTRRSPPSTSSSCELCAAAGQTRPTPLILRYGEGDWNALHQDLYGEVFFPFQVLTILARPGVDFEGGEFVLLEQRPRAQSRAHVLTPARGRS